MELKIEAVIGSPSEFAFSDHAHVILRRTIKGLCDLSADEVWNSCDPNMPHWSWGFPKEALSKLKAQYATRMQ